MNKVGEFKYSDVAEVVRAAGLDETEIPKILSRINEKEKERKQEKKLTEYSLFFLNGETYLALFDGVRTLLFDPRGPVGTTEETCVAVIHKGKLTRTHLFPEAR